MLARSTETPLGLDRTLWFWIGQVTMFSRLF